MPSTGCSKEPWSRSVRRAPRSLTFIGRRRCTRSSASRPTGSWTPSAPPELTVFELRASGYVLEATLTQPLTVLHPFTVSITPADLTKGLLR